MTERFNVSGALLVKLFGRHDDEADDVRRSRRPGARHRRAQRDVRPHVLHRPRRWSARSAPRPSTASAATWSSPAPSPSARWSRWRPSCTRIYAPLTALTNARVDIMTAFVSFDRVFEVLDTPNAIADRPGADRPRSTAPGSIEIDDVWFRYPAASEVSHCRRSRPTASGKPLPRHAWSVVLRGVTAAHRAGPAGRARRAVGRRQDDDQLRWSRGSTT